ncbi:alpha/beta hydrolase [Marinicrinis sediminis]|uniref:Alpha/beta hydrolase n=1 Tax=Marinicrinis sediminis TaxID=1652465 RepID=A0ABW5RC99_9BACL
MMTPTQCTHSGRTLRGMIHQPKTSSTDQTSPVVIMFHGFTGHKGENQFLFRQFADYLDTHGIGCVRFDFNGSGDSDGTFAEMTVSREIEDGLAIVDHTKQMDWVDPDRIYLLGFSLGGVVASQVASRTSGLAKLCLWSPAGTFNEKAARYHRELPAQADGSREMGGLVLGAAFFEDLQAWDVTHGIEAYPGPVRMIHGEADDVVPAHQAAARYQAAYGDRVSVTLMPDADHVYSNRIWREKLFTLSVQFIQDQT